MKGDYYLWTDLRLDSQAVFYDRARAAVTAYLAEAGDGWRDIETAPKDGTRFLVFGGGADKVEVCTWDDRVGAWDLDHTMLEDFNDQSEGYSRPTHWRPLPKAPEVTSDD
jgi:hypothetical protein